MEGPFELFVGDLMTANEATAALPFSIMHTVVFFFKYSQRTSATSATIGLFH